MNNEKLEKLIFNTIRTKIMIIAPLETFNLATS